MADSLIGTVIAGRYRLEQELGRGGFGVVYLARNLHLRGRQVVVKILLDREDASGWFRAKFAQEVEALARIHHPGVVSVVDTGVLESGEPFLVQEYIVGKTLASEIKPGGMDLDRAASIVQQIGQALAEVHRNGVLHRDLKPDNVMLRPVEGGGEHVTLIDFGIASVAEEGAEAERKTKVAGTFAYMAPEQFDGRPVAASDAYALGVMAFEMLAGATPSAGKPMFELMLMQREGTWPRISQLRPPVPQAAEDAMRAALAYRAEDRPAAAEFAAKFAAALQQRGSQPEVPVPQPVAAVAADPWRLWRPIGAGLGVIVLALAAWRLSQGSTRSPETAALEKQSQEKQSQEKQSQKPAAATRERVAYWLTVQPKPAAGRRSDPFLLARERAFSSGDQIYFEFQPAQDGWLYIINQAPLLDEGAPVYIMLFPTPSANAGQARVTAQSKPIRIPEQKAFEFQGQGGMERVWVVWAEERLAALESLPAGEMLSLDARRRILHVLGNHEQSKALAVVDELDHRTRLSADRPGMIIHRIELYQQRDQK